MVLSIILVCTADAKTQEKNQSQNEERMVYADTLMLTWKDFRGKAPTNSNLAAETASGIFFSYECGGEKFKATVYAYFDPVESWFKTKATEKVLEHEQTHFEITELFARKFRQRLQQEKNPCRKSSAEFQRMFNQIMQEHRQYQNQYDSETKHSILWDEQRRWSNMIKRELNRLASYAK